MNIKKLVITTILLLSCVLLLTGCSFTPETEDQNLTGLDQLKVVQKVEEEGMSTYQNNSGIAFDYPSDWISVGDNGMVMYINPDGSGTSVNLVSEEISNMISFSGYMEAAKAKVGKEMDIIGDITQEELNLNGRRAFEISYTANYEENNITMKLFQVVIRKENTIYILSTGAVESELEAQMDPINKIKSSLRIVD